MKKHRVTIPWKEGLHLRPATRLVRIAQSFQSNVTLKCGAAIADARSVLSILLLCAAMGAVLEIEAAGDDEQQAIAAIESVFSSEDAHDLGESVASPAENSDVR
jgi:phosphotransferase system HPr (HPr) family protein